MEANNSGQEMEFSGRESLELITRMISKAKDDYRETGISSLLWGSVIPVCALVTFFNYSLKWKALDFIWLLTVVAVIPQIIIARKEKKERKHKGYQDDMRGGVWLSFGISVFVLAYVAGYYEIRGIHTLFLVIYGIPTFTTGFGCNFRPMVIGGIACWVFAILSLYTPLPYSILYNAAAALVAWFVPGLILRRRYLKAKDQHV